MTQIVKPIADLFVGVGWTKQSTGGTVDVYLAINEGTATPDNGDYAIIHNPAVTAYVCKLAALDPGTTGVGVLTLVDDASGSGTFTIEVRKGYVSEGAKGTLLDTATVPGTQSAFGLETDNSIDLTGLGAGVADVSLRIVPAWGTASLFAVSAIQLETDDAAPGGGITRGSFASRGRRR